MHRTTDRNETRVLEGRNLLDEPANVEDEEPLPGPPCSTCLRTKPVRKKNQQTPIQNNKRFIDQLSVWRARRRRCRRLVRAGLLQTLDTTNCSRKVTNVHYLPSLTTRSTRKPLEKCETFVLKACGRHQEESTRAVVGVQAARIQGLPFLGL